jgi:hypothetical protein
MFHAVYRQLSVAHGWSLVCVCEDESIAGSVATSMVAYLQHQGYTEAKATVVEFDSYDSITESVVESLG